MASRRVRQPPRRPRRPKLRRLELSYAGFYACDWIHFVAVSVYAYAHGGATSVGIYGLVRMSASAVAAPLGGVFVDRYPRQRALLAIHLGRAAALAAVAVALASGRSRASVFALAALVSLCGGPFPPGALAMLPSLAETPQQLVAANLTSSVFEGGAVLAGPALAGGLLEVTAPATVVAAAAGVSLWAALLVVGLGRDRDWARRRSRESAVGQTIAGLRTLRRERHTGLVIGLLAAQRFTRGLMNVLVVSASIQFLREGGSGVGWRTSGSGVGRLIGGLASVRLVGRRRLATPLALAAWSARRSCGRARRATASS